MPLRRLALSAVLLVVAAFGFVGSALAQAATPSPTPPAPVSATSTVTPAAQPTRALPTATPLPQPVLTLTSQQGPPGTSIGAIATFFSPGEQVQLLFNGNQVASANANTAGTVSFQFGVPGLNEGQYPVVAVGQNRRSTPVSFSVAGSQLTLSTQQGPPGTSVVLTGSGFQPGETILLAFNGAQFDMQIADTTGSFSATFKVPTLAPGDYQVEASGQTSNLSSSATFTIGATTAALSAQSGAAGASITVTGAGFLPGDAVQLIFNGALVDSNTADSNGTVTFTFAIPRVPAGNYLVLLLGHSGGIASATLTVTAGNPALTPVPVTPTPRPTTSPEAAPPVVHDARYFGQTGYRIDDDDTYAFFLSNGGIQTFGYPTSRTFTFLGCPVQFFQRQIIQVCSGQAAALLNILDPGIFPYTQVNGSTFPAPDEELKASTPPVSDPNYLENITAFVAANVPNTFGGQPVDFLDYYNAQGGLTIWGAPISEPAPDPGNVTFIYQRFQRGIMHYIQSSGTESILVADYLKSMILNEDVPPDLLAEATQQESPYLASYCPGSPLWMCRPGQVPGTDYTFAFVPD